MSLYKRQTNPFLQPDTVYIYMTEIIKKTFITTFNFLILSL